MIRSATASRSRLLWLVQPRSPFPEPSNDCPHAYAQDTSLIGSPYAPPCVPLACPARPRGSSVKASLLARSGSDSHRSTGLPRSPLIYRALRSDGFTAVAPFAPPVLVVPSFAPPFFLRPWAHLIHRFPASTGPLGSSGVLTGSPSYRITWLEGDAALRLPGRDRRKAHEISEWLRQVGWEVTISGAARVTCR